MPTVTHSASDAGRSALLAELRDGLARLQPEIPSKYLADPAVQALRARVGEVFAGRHAVERSLLATLLPTFAPTQDAQPNDGRRVFCCLANALGATTTVGAVRLLRDLRARMRTRDSLVIGVDLRESLLELQRLLQDQDGINAPFHRGVLTLLNERFDANFDESVFEYRVLPRKELYRLETHLVVRKAHEVSIAGTLVASLKKGDSVLTSVRCTFTRGSLEALLNGVGFELNQWAADDLAHFAVGVCVPMRREM